MAFAKFLALALVAVINLQEIHGHGMMMDPVNRSSAWRKGFPTPRYYNDNEHFCGGVGIHHGRNGGKCGECGDNYANPRPRINENGGVYGTGVIVQQYKTGATIEVLVRLTASHLGHFEFNICPLKSKTDLETDECFNQYPLSLADGSGYKFPITAYGAREYKINLNLPQNLECKHCVMRWNYRTGNTWGTCDGGRQGMGCGPQETFRSCSDISISN